MTFSDPEKNQQYQEPSENNFINYPLVVPLAKLNRTQLSLAGGKAANLGELIQAGFAVPEGFCITTAAYKLVRDSKKDGPGPRLEKLELELELATLEKGVPERLVEELASTAEAAWLNVPVPTSLVTAITEAYQELSKGELLAVAVRSSATAEDLPSASFAGQHESYLNVVGIEAVLKAVRRCWASLWKGRALSYRANLDLASSEVYLAVVVQRMAEPHVSGVLFTANPITGKRHQAVIDASPGLGEAVVSGATNPDHFVVSIPSAATSSGEVIERFLGDKRVSIHSIRGGGTRRVEQAEASRKYCLTEAQVLALAELGARLEKHMEAPQDIEWAIDEFGQTWLLQARPITTLFPLPENSPTGEENLRVYLSFNIQQGTYRPTTPMGISATRLLASALLTLAGYPLPDPKAGPDFIKEAASRVFFDVTPALRRSFGRKFLAQAMSQTEVHAATIFERLAASPQFSLLPAPRLALVRTISRLLVRTGLPWHVLRAIVSPGTAHARLLGFIEELRISGKLQAEKYTGASDRLAAVEQLTLKAIPRLLSNASPVMLGGMATYALSGKLLGKLATEGELQVVLRGAPFNPTTEMNLALWALAREVSQANPATADLINQTPATRLAENYRKASLPSFLQEGLTNFLAQYGHRSVAELDAGQPRWSEDPTYLLERLTHYLEQVGNPALSPVVQFRRAAEEAEEMISELTGRAKHKSWLRGLLARFFLRRAHALGGMREMPRFCLSLLLAQARELLWPVGEELTRAGRLEKAEDIFYITLAEIQMGMSGTDLREVANSRRDVFERELLRRNVPVVLLSDGTVPTLTPDFDPKVKGTLQGTPASPGLVTGIARVILDPEGARINQGEILIAPSTDPGWTPLFLSAGGLVMEMGGSMSHGAIVAREYGIPAVVAVSGATLHISSGQQITVDGSKGTILLS